MGVSALRRHAARTRTTGLLLFGARGRVGSALRALLAREASAFEANGLPLALLAAVDRRGLAHDAGGLDWSAPDAGFARRYDNDWPRTLERLLDQHTGPLLAVDTSASELLAAQYAPLLSRGIGIVSANKLPLAGPQAQWCALHALAARGVPLHYETTVGAALPVLGTIANLVARGERIERIEGVLSGSLSYILGRLHEGAGFSAAVREAADHGYTEPDPRADLEGHDLRRKALILARSAGFALEADAVQVQPLAVLTEPSDPAALATLDTHWHRRVVEARARRARLVTVVSIDSHGASIETRDEPEGSALAQLRPGQNLVRIHTEFHREQAIEIRGPGAGIEITAAGVLGDIVRALRK